MKLAAIWREAYRDIMTGTARVVLFALLFAISLGSLVAVDLLQVRTLTKAAENYQRVGASIVVLSAQGRVDGPACQALTTIPGIRAAGAIRKVEERLILSVLPGAPVPVSIVTSGFVDLLDAETSPGLGVILSDQVVDSLGVRSGSQVVTPEGAVRVAGIYRYPSDGRIPGYGYMALIPVNDAEPFDECWADIWPQSDALQSLLFTSLTPDSQGEKMMLGGPKVTVGQLNAALGAKFDGPSQFRNRITAAAPIAAALISAALGYVSLRVRRLVLASHLHAGVSRRNQRSIVMLETLAWIVNAVVLVEAAMAVLVASDPGADRVSLAILANRTVYLGVVGAAVGASISWLLTREKHLFRYFKSR